MAHFTVNQFKEFLVPAASWMECVWTMIINFNQHKLCPKENSIMLLWLHTTWKASHVPVRKGDFCLLLNSSLHSCFLACRRFQHCRSANQTLVSAWKVCCLLHQPSGKPLPFLHISHSGMQNLDWNTVLSWINIVNYSTECLEWAAPILIFLKLNCRAYT